MSEGIAQQLHEAQLYNAVPLQPLQEEPLQGIVPSKSDGELPIMPSLDHDNWITTIQVVPRRKRIALQ
jgi:hypothetical protein